MTKKEKFSVICEIASLSDKDLLSKTHDAICDSLGSVTDTMYDLGYDFSDISNMQKYEKFLSEKSDLYNHYCELRGIAVFDKED